MYLDYFSLDRHPFRITPDPSLFFPGGQDGRGVILNALIYGITSGEGILKVVGEVGSGKTMLCRMLEEKLPQSVEIVYIANPSLSAREILYAIAIELKLDVTAATERLKVMHLLQNYLLNRHSQGGTVVVFIEEAQSMPLETLEEIRLLSNLETHQHKLMQIVLFGQPELDKILAQKNIRQLRERITHSFRLEPLTTQATGDYLRYRLKAAGCPREHLFSPRAETMIARASSGLTRRINILADKSLLAAYADSPSRQPPQDSDEPLVQPRHVKAAIRDSDYRTAGVNPWLLGGLGATAVVVVVIVAMSLDLIPGSGTVTVPAADNVAVVAPPETRAQESVTGLVERESAAIESTSPGPGLVTAAIEEAVPEAEALPAISAAPENLETAAVATQPEMPDPAGGNAGTQVVIEETSLEPATADPVVPVDAAAEDPGQVLASLETRTATADAATMTDIPAAEARLPMPVETTVEESAVTTAQALPVSASPVTVVPAGLAELRMGPTAEWLRNPDIINSNRYTIQMFSVPSTNPNGLEEYLQFLQLVSLLDETYICFMPISSATSGRWQVMHKAFQGVTPARNFIAELPVYIQQYGPYVRNISGIECSYPVDTRD